MIVLYILLILVPAAMAWLLFSRLVIEIDTTLNVYFIRLGYLGSANLLADSNTFLLNVRILWWKKSYDLFAPGEVTPGKVRNQDSSSKVESPQKRTGSILPGKNVRKIKAVIRSFRIKKCAVFINTGDMPLNGILFPLFYLLSKRTQHTIMIRFNGESSIILKIENSLARMLWAYIKS